MPAFPTVVAIAFFCLRAHRNKTAAMMRIAPAADPTPMPAFAPVDKPDELLESVDSVLLLLLDSFGVGVESGLVVVVKVLGIEVLVDDTDALLAFRKARAGSIGAIATAVSVPQQSVFEPQHHSVEFSVPSQGVTCTVTLASL
jgi:hypothetical protein